MSDASDREPGRNASEWSPLQLLQLWSRQTDDYAIVFMRPDATIVAANRAVERLLGWSVEELIGGTLQRIFTAEDLARGLDRHELMLAAEVGRSEDDRWHVGKGGRRVWVSGVLMALRDEAGQLIGFEKTMRDRTDLQTLIDTLQNRTVDAAAVVSRQRDALASIGHELRNPLNTLSAAVVALAQDAERTDRLLPIMERQLSAMQRMLDDLRAWTEVGSGGIKLEFEELELQAAIRSALALHTASTRADRRVIRLVLPEPPILIQADPIRLEQILRNLLDNAIKYTPAGGHIAISATVEGSFAVIRIEDDGIGISADVMPRVFELFTREARPFDMRIDGVGVGLAVVRDLVRLHHGNIEVQSAGLDLGSEFTVRLPLRQGRARPADLRPD